jgi:Uma2 family endonuclease
MLGVWIAPVTAQLMITLAMGVASGSLRAGRTVHRLPACGQWPRAFAAVLRQTPRQEAIAMSGLPRPRRITPEAFYRFVRAQEGGRFELVDGEIVAMAGANRRHDHIAANGIRLLGNALAGHATCTVFTMDTFLRIPGQTNRRQADFGIDCGTPSEDSLEADQPRLIAEILSGATAEIDLFDKVPEYQTIPSVEAILVIDPNWPRVRVWHRAQDGAWPQRAERVDGLQASVALPQWGFEIRLADLYGRLEFRPRPSLVGLEAMDQPREPGRGGGPHA